MIDPEAGKSWLGVALFMIIVALILMFSLPTDSAGFVVSTISLIAGLLMLAGLVVLIRRSQK